MSEGRAYLDTAWWIAVFRGFALVLTTMSINRLGDWLRSVLDTALGASANDLWAKVVSEGELDSRECR